MSIIIAKLWQIQMKSYARKVDFDLNWCCYLLFIRYLSGVGAIC